MEDWEKLIDTDFDPISMGVDIGPTQDKETKCFFYKERGINIVTIGHVDHGKTTLTAAIEHLMKSDKTALVIGNTDNQESDFPNLEKLAPFQKPFVIQAPLSLSELSDGLGTYKDGQANRRERRKQQRKNGKK